MKKIFTNTMGIALIMLLCMGSLFAQNRTNSTVLQDQSTSQSVQVANLEQDVISMDRARPFTREQRNLLRAEYRQTTGSALRAPIPGETILLEGFEGTTGLNIPANWERNCEPADVNAIGCFFTSGTNPHSGTRSASVNLHQTAPAYGILWSPDLVLEAGQTYEFEIWHRWDMPPSGTPQYLHTTWVDVYKLDDDSFAIEDVVLAGTPQQSWGRLTGSFTATVSGNDFYLEIVANKGSTGVGGVTRIDDIVLRKASIPRPNDIAFQPYLFPMTQVPTSQTITVAPRVKNVGANAQTDVNVSVTNNNIPIGQGTPVASLAPGATQTFTIALPTTFALGANAIQLTASQTETDDDLSDNTLSFNVTGTRNVFATDDGTTRWIIGSTSSTTRSGNIFVVTEEVTLQRVEMKFSAVSNQTFNLNLYRVTNPATLTIASSAMFSQSLNRNTATADVWSRFTVPETVLTPGTYYLEAAESSNSANLSILADDVVGRGYSRSSGTATTLTVHTAGARCIRMVVDMQPNDLQIVARNPFLYTQVPESQLASATVPTSLVATARNEGLTAQTVVNFSATFNGAEFGPSNSIATIAPGATSGNMTITPAAGTFTLPTTEGIHPLVYTLSQTETPQADPTKGTITFPFIIGSIFAKDAVTLYDNGVGNSEPISAGNIFTISEATFIKQVQVGFGNTSPLPLRASLYRATGALTIAATPLFSIPFTRSATVMNIDVPLTELLPGDYYLCIDQLGDVNMSLSFDPATRTSTRLLIKDIEEGETELFAQTSFGAAAVRMVLVAPGNIVTITTNVAPVGAGTVTGGGDYEVGDPVTLTATANTGYRFVKWNDDVTTNPRTFNATEDATYTAIFELIPILCDPVTITAAAQADHILVSWTGEKTVNVYRNGTKIAPAHTGTSYRDETPVEGANCYKVEVICADELSPMSNEACETWHGINNITTTFSIAPNPATNSITISATNNFHTVEVVSFLGQTILSQSSVGNVTSLDVSNLTNGVYFVRVVSENGASVKKFVKQ